MSEGLKTEKPVQSTALKPYLDPAWDSISDDTKSVIIQALLKEPRSTLQTTYNEEKEQVIFCEYSGCVVSRKPYSRKIDNVHFKSEHELWNLKKSQI